MSLPAIVLDCLALAPASVELNTCRVQVDPQLFKELLASHGKLLLPLKDVSEEELDDVDELEEKELRIYHNRILDAVDRGACSEGGEQLADLKHTSLRVQDGAFGASLRPAPLAQPRRKVSFVRNSEGQIAGFEYARTQRIGAAALTGTTIAAIEEGTFRDGAGE